ncbi:hypothetical protein AVEN_145363-1 [Araneus ventricosus]|uniref:Uncharacterized protein n=1 Tax=Araneus ventricosus TaxID=182803 RepID=A0A4Y2QLW4_ARAVE|nr:hypothetical protein AVEN_145363-1 [Araneus ventricosus]
MVSLPKQSGAMEASWAQRYEDRNQALLVNNPYYTPMFVRYAHTLELGFRRRAGSMRVSEKKSINAQDKDEFLNYNADILMLYVEAVSSLVPEKNVESEQTSSMIDLFIELKNEFAAFRKNIYNKVDSFSKLICPTNDTIQNEEPRPSLQQEIIETELKSETSTYAYAAITSSSIPEDFNDISVWHSDSPLVPEDKHHPTLSVSMDFVPVHLNKRNVNIFRLDFKRADILIM